MTIYNVTILETSPGMTGGVLERAQAWLATAGLRGSLIAAWNCEIGPLNTALLVHRYEGPGMAADRDVILTAPDPFGGGPELVNFTLESFDGAGALDMAAEAGPHGAYEVVSMGFCDARTASDFEASLTTAADRPLAFLTRASGSMPGAMVIRPAVLDAVPEVRTHPDEMVGGRVTKQASAIYLPTRTSAWR